MNNDTNRTPTVVHDWFRCLNMVNQEMRWGPIVEGQEGQMGGDLLVTRRSLGWRSEFTRNPIAGGK